MEVSKEILNNIAGNMESGFKCFIHRETLEVVTYRDMDEDLFYMEANPWKEEIKKIKKGKKKYIELANMDSRDSFKVMEEFANTLENNSTKIRLLTALQGKRPFANFKFQVDNSGKYREQWFAFRREKIIEWIQDRLSFES